MSNDSANATRLATRVRNAADSQGCMIPTFASIHRTPELIPFDQRPQSPLGLQLLEDADMLGTASSLDRCHPGIEPLPLLRFLDPPLRQPLGLDARAVAAVLERIPIAHGVFIAELAATSSSEPFLASASDRSESGWARSFGHSLIEGRVKAGQIGGFWAQIGAIRVPDLVSYYCGV